MCDKPAGSFDWPWWAFLCWRRLLCATVQYPPSQSPDKLYFPIKSQSDYALQPIAFIFWLNRGSFLLQKLHRVVVHEVSISIYNNSHRYNPHPTGSRVIFGNPVIIAWRWPDHLTLSSVYGPTAYIMSELVLWLWSSYNCLIKNPISEFHNPTRRSVIRTLLLHIDILSRC